jgi:hypothetical protein
MKEPLEAVGHKIELDDNRHVFVGQCEEHPDKVFIEFRNGDAIQKVGLTIEAAVALRDLLPSGHSDLSQYQWILQSAKVLESAARGQIEERASATPSDQQNEGDA